MADIKAIVPVEGGRLMPKDIEGIWRVGQMLLGSGLLPRDIKSPEAAAVFVNAAMELQIPFTAAITGIAIVNGRPLLHSKLPLALAMKTGQFRGLEEEWTGLAPDGSLTPAAVCTVIVRRQVGDQVLEFVGRFGMADAKQAGLAGKGVHGPYPKDMLYARASSRALSRGFADALCGMGVVQPEDEDRVFAPRRVENEALAAGAGTAAIDAIPDDEQPQGAAGSAEVRPPQPAAPSPDDFAVEIAAEMDKAPAKKRPAFDLAGNPV
jgi:hypothetical protein